MKFLDALGQRLLFLDGAMGTMLQHAGLKPGEPPDTFNIKHPDIVRDIHAAYLNAGCNILTTNTFGCTRIKLEALGYSPADVARAAVKNAKDAITAHAGEGPCFVAFDVGPTGKLLEPLGDLPFEQAVAQFGEAIAAGAEAGADLVLVETMSDTYELKAAVLAAKEYSDLPVAATVVVDDKGNMLTGGDVAAATALLEGLGAAAIGLNCGLGPKQLLPFIKEMRTLCSLPLILTPNAGLPRVIAGETVYDVSPERFAQAMKSAVDSGVQVLGGCCGTTPGHMQSLVKELCGLKPLSVTKKRRTVVSSFSRVVDFENGPVIIGERINPTGKPRLKAALREENYDYILREAIAQQENGAAILDVNAGLPDIDEARVLARVVTALQGVTDIPLEIDTANEEALALAMRLYNGKPLINSVNGKEESMRAVFPLIKKYGGVAVALTLDESGIPDTARGRLDIARRIVQRAADYGIPKEDILVDALTMTISAGQHNAAVTLEALSLIKAELGVKSILGVSNVSFGLPAREALNAAFFTMAMTLGLDAAILNPHSKPIIDAYHSHRALTRRDPQCAAFIARYSDTPAPEDYLKAERITLSQAVRSGLKLQAAELTKAALLTRSPMELIDDSLVPALNDVGEAFEKGVLYLPQLLMSAEAAKAAFEVIRASLGAAKSQEKGVVIVATVEGDIHDIGKNIAKAMLENYQFKVVDLGKDVKPERVLEAARAHGARLVGLSALMTTTVSSMKKTIALLKSELPHIKIMVGGAVLTPEYAAVIGADMYVKDALASVHFANNIYA